MGNTGTAPEEQVTIFTNKQNVIYFYLETIINYIINIHFYYFRCDSYNVFLIFFFYHFSLTTKNESFEMDQFSKRINNIIFAKQNF